ncbi:uncharacterized protein LOC143002251 isoform X2 [Genypterus blacodes]|uniref:uncharacterized protein LOC143002251 isoform X2 n=1 Tax=Genypterus blacodes TaxID=154954 RepID=UPI003F765400
MHEEDVPPLGFGDSPTQPSSEMKPHHLHNYVFATPTAKSGVKAKPQMSGTQHLITPLAKYKSWAWLKDQQLEQDLALETLNEMANSMLDVTAGSPMLQPNSWTAPPDIRPVTPVRNTVDEPQEVVCDGNPEPDVGSAQSSKLEMISSGTNVTLNNCSFFIPSLDATRDITAEDSPISSRPSSRLDGTVELKLETSSKAELSASTDLHTAAQPSSPQNITVDLSPPAEDQPPPASADTTEADASLSGCCSAAEASGSGVVKNGTFNMNSQSSSGTTLGEHTNTTIGLQNTFDLDSVSKSNSTRTLSKKSLSVCCQNDSDVPSPPRLSNASVHSQSTVDLRPDGQCQLGETAAGTDPNIIQVDLHEAQCEVTATSGADTGEVKAQSPSGGLPETSDHQCTDAESDKSHPFNLDDTLDLRADALITSTPMTDLKVFSLVRQEEGKIWAAQKKLYGDGGGGGGLPAEPPPVPSNIVGDRKTFLALPAAVKSLLPPSTAASQLWKRKPALEHPWRPGPATSCLPMTRSRAHMETSTNMSAAPEETAGISSSCIGAVQTRSKQPTGLRRPQPSGIPSATQRATGLRLPSTRGNLPPPLPSSSGADKPSGPECLTGPCNYYLLGCNSQGAVVRL